ncbi:MAG: HD-GYP domain-containing protein [Thermoleophilaceae bacterium]
MAPLSNATRRAARVALERADADARSMPGDLLDRGRLRDLGDAARRIVSEVEQGADHPIDTTVAGLLVGQRLDLSGDAMLELGLGLFLQDIGMLALPPALVHKAGPLADDELELLRRHPLRGLDLLRDEPIGPAARSVVRSHHERWDGAGYPHALAGEEIPLFARIAAVAASPSPDALREGAGAAFDPELVELCCDVLEVPELLAAA